MHKIPFYKMSGSGNDFIIIDNRPGYIANDRMAEFAARVCRRRMSTGADGVFFLEASPQADFKWHFFNADGSRAEMCGNGARCAARFAVLNNMAPAQMAFETDAGIIRAQVRESGVRIRLTEPLDMVPKAEVLVDQRRIEYGFVNTGVPHVVIETADIEAVDVVGLGRVLRHHPRFAPAGTNVNFVARTQGGDFAIRTYERGVEDETLACGTGNAAAAILLAARHGICSPVRLLTRSGCWLIIHFQITEGRFHDLELEGDARVVYEGVLWPEALDYDPLRQTR
jgi:diaminopimelate epimerase